MPEGNLIKDNRLPAKCGQDCITLLARDPHWLYVYWEITEDRKNILERDFGKEFIEKSYPVLKITNISRNDSFYVRINDFSSNWYVNVPDPNSIYIVEIGRRISENFFVSILNSNCIATPGDSTSSDTSVYFANYADLREGRQEIKKVDYSVFVQRQPILAATSSQEFFSIANEENYLAESSAQFYIQQMKG